MICALILTFVQTAIGVATNEITLSRFLGNLLHSYIFLATIILRFCYNHTKLLLQCLRREYPTLSQFPTVTFFSFSGKVSGDVS
jgi:hypothetical protein